MHKSIKNLFLITITTITVLMNGCVFAAEIMKHFSDYTDITPAKNSDPGILRTHYFAKQKVNDRAHDPLYKNNQWKLVQRRGMFLAQVDKAMSEMYRYFLGYSTDVDIVEEKGDLFIARRAFKHFKKAFNPGRKEVDYIRKVDNKFLVGGFELQDNGRLIKDAQTKQFKGLASIAVLTDFFAEGDAGDFNFGFQVSDDEVKTVFYDCEHAFTFEVEEGSDGNINIENELKDKYGSEFVNMTWYQQEKQQMLKKIADTDFSVIETILRKNINSSRFDEARYVLNKVLSDPKVLPEYDRAEAKKQLDEISKMPESGIEEIIQEMRKRHEKLRAQLKAESR